MLGKVEAQREKNTGRVAKEEGMELDAWGTGGLDLLCFSWHVLRGSEGPDGTPEALSPQPAIPYLLTQAPPSQGGLLRFEALVFSLHGFGAPVKPRSLKPQSPKPQIDVVKLFTA